MKKLALVPARGIISLENYFRIDAFSPMFDREYGLINSGLTKEIEYLSEKDLYSLFNDGTKFYECNVLHGEESSTITHSCDISFIHLVKNFSNLRTNCRYFYTKSNKRSPAFLFDFYGNKSDLVIEKLKSNGSFAKVEK